MKKENTTLYEAPALRYLQLETEEQFTLSMSNGFIYDAEDQDEYWIF